MRTRVIALGLVLSILALGALPFGARAQRGTRGGRRGHAPPPRAIPMEGTIITWTAFVSSFGETPSHRQAVELGVTTVQMPAASGWTCTVSAPNRAAIDPEHWSEVRTVECTHGEAIVSTTGFCQISGPGWGARAGVLTLGTSTSEDHVQITVDCAVQN
jgi:hypothetical protein